MSLMPIVDRVQPHTLSADEAGLVAHLFAIAKGYADCYLILKNVGRSALERASGGE